MHCGLPPQAHKPNAPPGRRAKWLSPLYGSGGGVAIPCDVGEHISRSRLQRYDLGGLCRGGKTWAAAGQLQTDQHIAISDAHGASEELLSGRRYTISGLQQETTLLEGGPSELARRAFWVSRKERH